MSIKDDYFVQAITKDDYEMWLLKKHYAKRIPCIMFAYGLYTKNKVLRGICTFGPPAKLMNNGYCIFNGNFPTQTYELNRLVVSEGIVKNALSWFVSQCLCLLNKPSCVVSYSDIEQGHHGYIYQATNWIYTGITEQTGGYTYFFDGNWQHPRTTVSRYGTREHAIIIKKFPNVKYKKMPRKHRYFQFLGTKKQQKEMRAKLKYHVFAYPKGENKRYDASYEPETQDLLF